MTSSFGISGGGDDAEQEFRRLTGATIAPKASVGDAMLEGDSVEIKAATTSTLNQVRAVKYIPIVALDRRTNTWYVVPAHVVVVAVSRKRRGQHTENPFESATLNLTSLAHYKVESGELRERTLAAIEESSRYIGLREEMARVLASSRALAEESLARVRARIDELGLADLVVGRGGHLGSHAAHVELFGESE